jgi:hypothetical protein
LDETAKLTLASGLHVQPVKAMEAGPFDPVCYLEAAVHAKEAGRFRIVLRITSEKDGKDELLPYRFDVTLVGFFRTLSLRPTATIEPFILRNAATILYSSARELLASVTGRGPLPALVLPTVSFADEPPVRGTTNRSSAKKKAPKTPGRAKKRAVKK